MTNKLSIRISPEFTSFVGRGPCDPAVLPPDALIFGFGDIGEPAVSMLLPGDVVGPADDHLVVLAISRTACDRLFALRPKADGRWYLPANLRGLGRAVVAVEGDSEVDDMLRSARSQELLCQLFAELAPEWPAHRMPAIDRAVLRLAFFEMHHSTNPPKAVVNEAVELAKHFSTADSPKFINALLDKVLKRVLAARPGVEATEPA